MAQFYVCGGRDSYWMATNAKTINGAKAVASKTYHTAVGGRIEVGEKMGSGDAERIECVASKTGYDAWRQA